MTRAPGDAFRARALQPLVDAAFAHLRVNCFALASGVLSLHVAVAAAYLAHGAAIHAVAPADVVIQGAFSASAAVAAKHLRDFGRRRHGGAFRVVHPLFRQPPVFLFFFAMACIYPLMRLPALAFILSRGDPVALAWTLSGDVAFMLFPLGFMVAGCEWRRLPPAERPWAVGRPLPATA